MHAFDVGDVLELEPGADRVVGQPDGDPGDPTAELPGRGQVAGRLAGGDLAAGVVLDLEPAAEPEVAGDRGEPAWDPLGVGDGLPEVVDVGGVGAGGDHDLDGRALVGAVLDGAGHRAQVIGYVEHAGHCFRFR